MFVVFVFKQKAAYEVRISDWSSDVCSSDLSGLKEALQENGRAAKFLKLCKSPCYPENVTVEQIKRLESILEAMPPEIKVNSAKISEALKEMDEQQIWAFLDHFEDEKHARAKMLSDLGHGGGGVDDVDDIIEVAGGGGANGRGTGEKMGQASGRE